MMDGYFSDLHADNWLQSKLKTVHTRSNIGNQVRIVLGLQVGHAIEEHQP